MNTQSQEDFADISIIIASYNPGPQILECLSKISELDYPPSRLEVIVMDDCSAEDVPGMVSAHFPQYKVIGRTRNEGCDATREDGLKMASGRFLANTDTDCMVDSLWARRINAVLQTGAAAVTGPVLHQPGLRAQMIAVTQFGYSQSLKNGRTHAFPGCNFAVTREAYQEFGYQVPGLRDGADRLLAWRIASAGQKVIYDREMIVRHYPSVRLRSLLKRWSYYPSITYHLRQLAPDLPGGWILRTGPMAPFLLSSAKLVKDYERLFKLGVAGRIPIHLIPPLAALFPLVRAIDMYGAVRAQVQSLAVS